MKREEYREDKPWIRSRLEGRTYEFVRFENGYGPDAPVCIVEFKGWHKGYGVPDWGAPEGKLVIVIKLGEIVVPAGPKIAHYHQLGILRSWKNNERDYVRRLVFSLRMRL